MVQYLGPVLLQNLHKYLSSKDKNVHWVSFYTLSLFSVKFMFSQRTLLENNSFRLVFVWLTRPTRARAPRHHQHQQHSKLMCTFLSVRNTRSEFALSLSIRLQC